MGRACHCALTSGILKRAIKIEPGRGLLCVFVYLHMVCETLFLPLLLCDVLVVGSVAESF